MVRMGMGRDGCGVVRCRAYLVPDDGQELPVLVIRLRGHGDVRPSVRVRVLGFAIGSQGCGESDGDGSGGGSGGGGYSMV